MKEGELELLRRLAAGMPEAATVVEIGSWKGRSTLAIADGLATVAGARLVAVDTFGGRLGFDDVAQQTETRSEFNRNTAGIPFLEVLEAESLAAADRFADATLDWVFIDALHDYASVKADVSAWAPKLKVGGLLSGHDFGRAGVTDAVLRSFADVEVESSIWMTRDRPRLRPARVLRHHAKRMLGR